MYYLCTRNHGNAGALAQLVEHRTENPCVPCSIQGGTTYGGLELMPIGMSFFDDYKKKQ